MVGDLIQLLFDSKTHQVILSMLVLGVIGVTAVIIFERYIRDRVRTDTEKLFDLARSFNCSEFEIFRRAAKDWNFSDTKVEEDFKRYLSTESIPYYVRQYLKGKEDGRSGSKDTGD